MRRRNHRDFTPLLIAWTIGSFGCTALLGERDESKEHKDDQHDASEAERQVAEAIAAKDAELQALDPELFELALKYFPSSDAAGPAQRYYRLTRRQLDATANYVLVGQIGASALESLPPDPLIRNYELANDLGFNGANFTPYADWVDDIARGVEEDPSTLFSCASGDIPCLGSEARTFVRRAFRGVPSDEVQERHVDFFVQSVAELGLNEAVGDLVETTLSSPHFAFREEVFTDDEENLLEAQSLQNLSYTLADVPPGSLGLDSDSAGGPNSESSRSEAVAAVLSSAEARDKLLRFFIAWLEIKEPDELDISTHSFPEFTPELASAIVDETRQFLAKQLQSVAPSLKDITQSTESFVSSSLADIYGVDGDDGSALTRLDPDERLGIFTHPSFIASHSGPSDTRLVKRGAFFTRKVMCQDLGDPPDDAIPTGPIPGDTERERIEGVTQPAGCAGCHSFINPFGFMLESYDPLGRFRIEDEEGHPVDPSIRVDFLDEGPLAADRAVDALAGFTDSAMFRQCFVRQLFTFYMGRRTTSSDDPLLREMFFRFSEGESERIFDLLTLLAESSSFNRRVEPK